MQRGGQIIKPLSDTKSKLSALRDVVMDFHRRESFLDAKERVYTNHFQLTLRPDQELYEYKIESNLPGRNKRKFRALMKTVLGSYSFLVNNAASFATDHIDTIIAWKPLHLLIGSDPEHLKIHGDGQSPGSRWRLQPELLDGLTPIIVTFNFERIVDVTGLLRHTDIDPNYATIDLEPRKRALNILISKCFSEATPNMIQLGANKFFNKRGTSALRGSVSLSTMRGYYYTVKAGVRNVLLNINPCTSAFFNNVMVSQVMNDKPTFNPWELEGVLKGLRVYIELDRGDKNDTAAYKRLNTPQARVKTIQGLGDSLQQQTFQDANGVQQNVLAHLQIGKWSTLSVDVLELTSESVPKQNHTLSESSSCQSRIVFGPKVVLSRRFADRTLSDVQERSPVIIDGFYARDCVLGALRRCCQGGYRGAQSTWYSSLAKRRFTIGKFLASLLGRTTNSSSQTALLLS